MSKYNGPVCRFCRREAQKLFLKGERCLSDKCSFDRRGYPPGQHGMRRAKASEFGTQLREKQKVRRAYGVQETQFRNTFEKSMQERGVTAEIFFRRLELRLDNVVFRMGFAATRQEARQVVRHNHIMVNGKRLNIPSAMLKLGDTVSVSSKSQKMALFTARAETFKRRASLAWVEVNHGEFKGKVIANPTRADIGINVRERLVVELYSK